VPAKAGAAATPVARASASAMPTSRRDFTREL
jgi:hypothetical protein